MSALSAPAGGGTTTQTKPSTGKSKFQKLDINNLYCHSRGENSEPSLAKSQLSRKHGMQSLGKVPSARRPPANLPSLKTESGQDSTPNSSNTASQISGTAPSVISSAGSTAPTPSLSTTTATAASPVVNQPCPPPSNTSHQHASAFPAGWASLPAHRTTQFQQEFPSLDGEPHAAGPSLRPQTEGSWTAGGSRPGVPDGPAPGGDSRPSQFNRTLVPNFMYKGSTGAGGPGGFPPAMMAQGPPMSGNRQAHGPLSRGPQRAREVPGTDKMQVQKPIICEEDLRSMDEIARDTGWATHDDIDYNQKLNFSDDDESPSKDSSGPNRHHKQNVSGAHAPRTMDKDTMDKRHPQPSIVTKTLEDDEVWEMRQRQHSNEVAAVIERAKQRKQQEEQRQQEAAKQKSLLEQSTPSVPPQSSQNTQPPSSTEWDRNKEQEKPNQNNKMDKPRESERSGSHPPVLNRSTSRDNVRPNNDQSEFRQMSQIGDGRVIREQKDRERGGGGRDRDYHRERDFYREKTEVAAPPPRIERGTDRDRDSDRGSDRDRDRNRDHLRTERERDREMRSERDPYFKPFHADMPPRFLKKQQGRGGHSNYDRMSSSGSDRGDFGRGGPGGHDGPPNAENEKQNRRNDENKAPMPFGQQYDSRWNFTNSKTGQSQSNNQRNDNFHNSGGKRSDDSGSGKGGNRRNRTDSDISAKDGDKVDDRRRERHTPDEPRHPRHPPRKLSGSSDTRHSSNRDFNDRDDEYRYEKQHDRRSGSSYDDKPHSDYVPQREGSKDSSYDWRAEKDFNDKQNRNFGSKEMDRQSSRDSQKDFSDTGKKSDVDRKSVENYDQKPIGSDKLSEVFERKCSVQEDRKSETNERNSLEKSDKRDEKHGSNNLCDKLDSNLSKMSLDSSKDSYKSENYDKEYSGKIDCSYESYEKDRDNSMKSSKSSLERQFSDKSDNSKSDAYRSNYRDHRSSSQKDYKSDSDDNKRANYMHSKKNQLNSQKGDLITKENPKIVEDPNKESKIDTVQTLQTDGSKNWVDANIKSELNISANENLKNQSLDSNKQEEKHDDMMDSTNKDDSGKERLERKLSSSGSEKKSNSGVRYRTDSGNSSKRGYSGMVYRGSNWAGRGDSRRRGGSGGGRSHPTNRDSIYSESEISGDELNQQHNHGDKRRNARSPKSHIKKSEKEDRNRNVSKDTTSQAVQGENRNYQPKESANNNQGNQSHSRHDNRIEGRDAFAPRGEPSRRGRGGFRGGRGTVPFVGYGPHSTKSPFGQTNALQQSSEAAEGDNSKNDVHITDDKGRIKQQSTNAGIIGRERRNVPPRLQDKNSRNKGKIDGASGEEEAWETTSEHSEGGKKINKNDNRLPGQTGAANPKSMNEKKQNSGSNQDLKVNQKQGMDKKSDSKDNSGEHELIDDGFQEVRSKKNVKDMRGMQPPKESPDVHSARIHKHQPKTNENQRNNSSTRSSSEKSINPSAPRSGNSGPPNSMKINGPQNAAPHDRQMGPPQNSCKPNNFDQRRQNNLPPRFVRQMESMRNQKQQTIGQGFNSVGSNMDMNNVPLHVSAWDKPINQTLRVNMDADQSIVNSGLNTIDCPELCLTENHSGHSSQRSTPNISTTVDQKSAGSLAALDKTGLLDGTTTPVQTIIFENTNYKSAPENLKQKFVSPTQQINTNGNAIKSQQCANPKTIGHQQSSELDSQILGFTSDPQQTGTFITDLMNSENNQSAKRDASPIQLQMPFTSSSKTSEDSSDMKLDFAFDPELSQLTEDKGTKPMGLSRSSMHAISSSQNSMSLTTDRELNLKIASVKKVWDNTSMPTVIEHPTTDEVSHVQHNLNTHNMSVSSPHSLSSQHTINSQHISSQHNLTSQHNMTSQHNLSQQLTSPHGIAQHNLALGNQHNMNSNAVAAAQFNAGFEDHQAVNDVGQSQGFSSSGNAVNNQTTNVCKVKPTQQPLHSGPMTPNLQSMQALMNQNPILSTATALQSMGGMQGVGGVMGLSPPPMQHTYNHINYQSQYGGISAIPSPPTVVFNSSQQLINTSQQMSSQGGLYGPFPIDQTRNQYGGFPGGPYGASSAPYNYTTPDMFQGLPNQYRMQDLFQAGGAAFGQSGQLATNPNTVLISSTSNSLMSASVKPSNQPIGAIGTKGTSYQGQQYLSYGAPHEAQPPPPYATALPPPSIVRTGPQAPPPPPPPLQSASTYYSQNAGNQTGFYQQTGNVSANYGMPFAQPNQNHNNAGIQGFSSQVLPSFQMAAALQQYGRPAQHPQAYVGANTATGKQDHNTHLTRPQQLKSPLQDHQNAMFGVASMAAQGVVNQGGFGGGAPSPKGGGTPNSSMKGPGSGYVGGPAINQQMGGGNKQGSQHSPPHHKYQPQQPPPGPAYQHMSQVIQSNGRQASLNMAITRGGMQQRYPAPIQRPLPPQSQQLYNNRGGGNRHQTGNGPSHPRHTSGGGGGGYYSQNNNRNNPPSVVPLAPPPEQPKPVNPVVVHEETCTPPTTAAPSTDNVVAPQTSTPSATGGTTTETTQEKKAE